MNAEIKYQRNKTAKAKRDSEYQRKRADRYERENAKLREQITQLQCDLESERDYANQMEAKEKKAVAENEKLLDLVVGMWNDMNVCYEQYVRISSSDMRFYSDRMRKLGIEVDT